MKKIEILGIVTLLTVLQTGCVSKSSGVGTDPATNIGSNAAVSVSSIAVVNNQFIINGKNLPTATSIQLTDNGSFNQTLTIESSTSSKIVANGLSALSIASGAVMNFVISSASGAATYPVTFTIANGAITAANLSSMGATAGQVLKYNGVNWAPASQIDAQLYLGTWSAATALPAVSTSGDYYIVSVAGTVSGVSYAVGDWIICDGYSWTKVAYSKTAVTSFNGKKGIVLLDPTDYPYLKSGSGKITNSSINDFADIDLTTTAPINGDVLTYNSTTSKWVPSAAGSGGGGAVSSVNTKTGAVVLTTTDISEGTNKYYTDARVLAAPLTALSTATNSAVVAADSVLVGMGKAQAQINALSTSVSGKEPAITAGTASQYWKGTKAWSSLQTDVQALVMGSYAIGSNSALANTDTLIGALGKIQGQLDAKSNSASVIDWSVSGVQTIDPSRLSLAVADASKAVVTSGTGAIIASAVTATELGYVSGVTSAIQTQLNGKQATIDNTSVLSTSKSRIYGANASNYVELSVPTLALNVNFNFPVSNGTSGYLLQTDGAGNTSWTAPATAPVSSVNTKTGAVVLTTTDISEGTNKYYTDARVLAAPLTALSTATNSAVVAADSVLVGMGKAQAQINALSTSVSGKEPAITAGTSSQYWRGDKTWSTFATDAINSVLSSYTISASAKPAIANTDSVVGAFNKVQKYLNDINSDYVSKSANQTINGSLAINSLTGFITVPTPVGSTDAANKGYVDSFGQWIKGTGGNAADIYFSSGNIGVGTSAPGTRFHIVDNGANEYQLTVSDYYTGTGAGGAKLKLANSRGTEAVPTATISGDKIGAIDFWGYGTSSNEAASIDVNAAGTFSATSTPADMIFNTTAIGSLVSTERMRILNSGQVGIGVIAPTQSLEVLGAVKANHFIANSTTPAVAANLNSCNTGGTTPTATIIGSDTASVVTYTCNSTTSNTGATTAAPVLVVTVTFANAYAFPTQAPVCVISAGSAYAASNASRFHIQSTTTGYTIYTNGTSYAAANVAYKFNVHCIGY